VRIAVLSAFVVTLVLAGPRASQVLAARLRSASANSPLVQLDHVSFQSFPSWLQRPALLRVARDLQPWLDGEVPILDEDAALRLQAGLASVPWVQKAQLQRVFPNRLRLQLDLRRPVLQVRDAGDAILCLCDRDGVALPAVEFPGLPFTRLSTATGPGQLRVTMGERIADDRVQAAAAVAVEWRDELAPLVPGCPPLLEVDASNLHERYIQHPHYPEIRLWLGRSDGAKAVFAYDHAPDSEQPRVPVADKAQVLRAILGKHPGLAGLVGGDLRFTVRWQDWLEPRPGPDPAGPWNSR
jgi:hypothetical protein